MRLLRRKRGELARLVARRLAHITRTGCGSPCLWWRICDLRSDLRGKLILRTSPVGAVRALTLEPLGSIGEMVRDIRLSAK